VTSIPLRAASGGTAERCRSLAGPAPTLERQLAGDEASARSDLVTVSESRIVTGLYTRVPETVLWLLLAGSALSLAMVGYSAGLSGRRSPLSAVVMIVALGAVLTIVIDLDRPQEGFLRVSQQALIDVQARIGPPRALNVPRVGARRQLRSQRRSSR
jgi:hypothetical protein